LSTVSNFYSHSTVIIVGSTNYGEKTLVIWEDMIEVAYTKLYRSVVLELPRNVSSTRGNKYKLQNHSFHYNFRKFYFAARVVNVWNSLPDHVIIIIIITLFIPIT